MLNCSIVGGKDLHIWSRDGLLAVGWYKKVCNSLLVGRNVCAKCKHCTNTVASEVVVFVDKVNGINFRETLKYGPWRSFKVNYPGDRRMLARNALGHNYQDLGHKPEDADFNHPTPVRSPSSRGTPENFCTNAIAWPTLSRTGYRPIFSRYHVIRFEKHSNTAT